MHFYANNNFPKINHNIVLIQVAWRKDGADLSIEGRFSVLEGKHLQIEDVMVKDLLI